MGMTFGEARDIYAQRAALRSDHTLQAYLRAIELLLAYLGDQRTPHRLPVHNQTQVQPSGTPLLVLTADDAPIFEQFAQWLADPSEISPHNKPYSVSTILLRMAGIQHWFIYMADQGWLPVAFSLQEAVDRFKKYQHDVLTHHDAPESATAVTEIHDLVALMAYYAALSPPEQVRKSDTRFRRWELTRLRNHALVNVLGETGGQVSAILALNAQDVLGKPEPLRITVPGKGQHVYEITLGASLSAVRAYLGSRSIDATPAEMPLFISHDAKYQGQRMSRIIAWRVIQRAAQAVGLGRISPQDIRHWRAAELIASGATLEDVRQALGHRSLYTVRAFYGHMLED